ncbi:helix-turn-helix domain-containing protein [Thermochromatium tepidum]|uniref:helix-turn-helix domain-containing protein n=1 Tax=Thermochromatium tepidum TaxID=1050 RepID=UPI003CCE2288
MRSWFSINQWINPEKPNSPPIYSPPCTETTAGEVIKTKSIRIYPTAAQRNLFRQWLGTSRYVYNETVKHLGLPKEERAGHWMGASKRILASLPDWAKPVPYQIKKIAVEDAYKAFSNGIQRWRQTGEPFKLRFRSRKNPKQSVSSRRPPSRTRVSTRGSPGPSVVRRPGSRRRQIDCAGRSVIWWTSCTSSRFASCWTAST